MEARLEATSPVRLWWNKIGQWQALMTALTLAVFFVTLSGDKEDATIAAIAFGTITAVFAAAIAAFGAIAFTTTFIAFVAVIAVFVASVVATGTIAIAIVAFGAVFVIAAIAAVSADKVPGISKKAVWFSYMGEFLLILLPMAWVLRG